MAGIALNTLDVTATEHQLVKGIVGVKLIERTNQGTKLTAAGRSIYQDAKQMIEFSNIAIERARQFSAAEQNVIRVGTSILRPCKRLIDLWAEIDDGSQPFQIRIVPFDDEPSSLNAVISSLGNQIDCFVGQCDSIEWRAQHNILLLEPVFINGECWIGEDFSRLDKEIFRSLSYGKGSRRSMTGKSPSRQRSMAVNTGS